MPSYYTYLISSLPMLHFGAKPPFSYEKFMKMCEGLVPDSDLAVIASVVSEANEAKQSPSKEIASSSRFAGLLAKTVLNKWQAFDTALRNELVKIRASHKHIDPAKYVREDGCAEMHIAHLAMNAHRNTSVLEAERILDADRWHFLDELSLGHYFDIDILVIYALKLLILERWDKINTTDKTKALEGVLA